MAIVAAAAACALLLAVPGQTEVTRYVNDLLIFLDGAYRVAEGQVPNRDFHTALGPLAYYIPGAGYLLSGSLGGAMPVGTALVIVAIAPVMAHILGSRLRPAIAIPFALLLLLVLAAPFNLGEGITALSFGMFYNRIGWAALSLLLIMYLPPRETRARQDAMDAAAAALLALLLIYLKISYGVMAVAFLVFHTVVSPQRRWAVMALVATLASGVLIELFWRGTAAHLADLALAAEVSGGFRGTLEDRLRIVLANLPDYLVFALLTGFALWRTRSFRDVLFYVFCAMSGYAIMNQNFQTAGIITLFAGGAVAAERLMRIEHVASPAQRRPEGVAVVLLFLASILPSAATCALALGIHAVLAAQDAGEDFALPGFDGVKLVSIWSPGDRLFSANYINSLRNGAAALAEFAPGEGSVFVLDFVSPFSAGLGLPPPRGDSSWQHWGRTFNAEHVLPPDDILREVNIILDPKYPVERLTAEGLRAAYMPYIQRHFDFVGENVDWWVYRAKAGVGG